MAKSNELKNPFRCGPNPCEWPCGEVSSPYSCDNCTPVNSFPSSVQFVFDGVAEGDCLPPDPAQGCVGINGNAYILTIGDPDVEYDDFLCRVTGPISDVIWCSALVLNPYISYEIQRNGATGDVRWLVGFYRTQVPSTYLQYFASPYVSELDCSVPIVLTPDGSSGETYCDWSLSTCSVTPL